MVVVTLPPGVTSVPALSASDTLQIAAGSQTIRDGNILTGIALTNAYFGPGAAVNFPVSVPLKTDISGVLTYAQDGGSLYLWPGGPGTTVARVKHLGRGFLCAFGGGTVTKYEQRAGQFVCTPEVTVTKHYQGSGSATFMAASVGITELRMTGGALDCRRGFDDAYLYGGVSRFYWPENPGSQSACNSVTCTGGTHTWMFGNISTLWMFGPTAVFDVSNIVQDITIGTLYIDSHAYRNPANKQLLSKNFAVTKSTVYLDFDDSDTVA